MEPPVSERAPVAGGVDAGSSLHSPQLQAAAGPSGTAGPQPAAPIHPPQQAPQTAAQHAVRANQEGYAILPHLDLNPACMERNRLAVKMNPPSVRDILPLRLARVVESIAKPLGVPPSMAALPLLSVTSTVTGVALRLAPTPNHTEKLLTALWSVLNAPPGTGKFLCAE